MSAHLDNPGAPTVLVTGATAGIGYATAHALAERGCNVLLHGRTLARAQQALERMGCARRRCVPVVADLGSLAGVCELVSQVHANTPAGLHALVNNAGAAFSTRRLSPDGIEATVAVNHLAAAALTTWLMPVLGDTGRRGRPGRVVSVTSYLEARAAPVTDWTYPQGWGQIRAYAFSKLANLAYGYAVAQKSDGHITFCMVDPGAVRTSFQRSAGGPLRLIGGVGGLLMASPEKAARGIIEAVAGDQPAPNGTYLRAGHPKMSSNL